MDNWKEYLKFNLKAQDTPRLFDATKLDGRQFNVNHKNVAWTAAMYFHADPDVWELPAKNYFVRICLAYYISRRYRESFYDLLNDKDLLPYDDRYSGTYDEDKETYDKILDITYPGCFETFLGYQHTIDVFGYLYDPIISDHSLTIGYNLTGQEFFDTICFKKRYIEEFFFSLTHTMPKQKLDTEDVLAQLRDCDTYGIPGNLLLNTEASEGAWQQLIQSAMDAVPLQAVTVLTIDYAEKVKKAFPDLQVHISTHGATKLKAEDLGSGYVDVLNVAEPYYYSEQQQGLIRRCKELGIRVKYIVNRGCVNNKHYLMSELVGRPIMCCQNYQCKQLLKEVPWLDLVRTNLYKEMLPYYDFKYLKISTRELSNEKVRQELEYWTSTVPTKKVGQIEITPDNYNTFIVWCKTKASCKGNCSRCDKCKKIYERLMKQCQLKNE
jgi:hypothetical protein